MKNRSRWFARWMPWLHGLLIAALLLGSLQFGACSTQQPTPPGELSGNANDLFKDPFFTDPPYWDNPATPPDEQLADKPKEPEKPKSLLQKSGDMVFSTFVVGVSLAKMAIPFVGF
ncbi:MAG: hypothetical protein HYZ50_00770 [Deltaproteobacteria bacterium]|nr:hypothetical protein [Deltaproteobacteria bacterium]